MSEAIYAFGGLLVGILLPWALQQRSAKATELREVRIALIDTLDVAWKGSEATVRHLAKLQVRLHTLGYPRDFLDEVVAAASRITIEHRHAGSYAVDIPGVDDDEIFVSASGMEALQSALEAVDLKLGPRRAGAIRRLVS